jgi:hypothetical protein
MTSTFGGGTCYTQSAEVLGYLKIQNYSTVDASLLDNTLIPLTCTYIDNLAGTTWGSINVTETLSIGRYALYGMYVVGAPVYLSYFPVIPYVPGTQTLQSFKIWNGNQYQEWAGVMLESRFGSYWVLPQDAIVFVLGWYWYMGAEVETTYSYGYNTTGTVYLDGQVHELAILKSAQLFLSSERYTALVTQGIGGVEMPSQWDYLNKRIKDLEDYIKGYKTIQGGIIS